MTSPSDKHVRQSDDGIKVVREIPLWGIISLLVVVFGQAVAMYTTQTDQGKTLIRFEKEMTDVKNAVQSQSMSSLKTQYELDLIKARLAVLEASAAKK